MHLRTFLKPFSFIPAILIMYMIFSFSAQNAETSSAVSYKVSYNIIKAADKILDANLEEWQIEDYAVRYHGVTRKIAHMGEYFLLAIAISFPLYVYGMHGILLVLVSGFFCVAFACTDEYHQSFISGRSPQIKDVYIDSAGILIGILVVRIIGFIGRHTIFRPISRKDHGDELSRKEIKRLKKQQLKTEKKLAKTQYLQQQAAKAAPVSQTHDVSSINKEETPMTKSKGGLFNRRRRDQQPEDFDEYFDDSHDKRYADRHDRYDDRRSQYNDDRRLRYDDRYDDYYDDPYARTYDRNGHYDSRTDRYAQKNVQRERYDESSDDLDDDMPLSRIFRRR